MSNFRSKAFNPASKRVEVAEYCDDYYGRHRYGIRFDDGCVHPESQCGIDAAATQLDSLRKERDALQARVKEWEDHTGPYLLDRAEQAESRATRLQQERDGLEAQLPDGMRHCTITFHECEKGHGRLSATNWIDSGCLCCQRDELKSNQERLWCKACGTVTRDRTCDCNRWPHLADAGYEPKFVNYADAMATDARLACLDVERLQQERDEAYERAAKECSDYARWAEQQISEDDPAESSKSQLFATISNTADDCAAAIRRLAAGPEKEGK